MESCQVVNSKLVAGISIDGLNCEQSNPIKVPPCYTKEDIPARWSSIPDPDDVMKWSHLQEVAEKMYPKDNRLEIGLLIGYNCEEAMTFPKPTIREVNKPFAVYTGLGWGVMGKLSGVDYTYNSRVCFKTVTKVKNPPEVEMMMKAFDAGFEEKRPIQSLCNTFTKRP